MPRVECRLCAAENAVRRSHVLPEFFYREVYESTSHTAISVSSHPRHRRVLPVQKGIREPLLGLECEKRFSRYESYAASILTRVAREAEAVLDAGISPPVVRLPSFDYTTFKLFGLSVLWRMGESKHPMFNTVWLGPHRERLRSMLLGNDPGKPAEYPFAALRIAGVDMAPRLITGPGKTRFGPAGIWTYMLTAMGFEWIFMASRQTGEYGDFEYFVGNAGPDLLVPIHLRERGESIQELLAHIPALRREVEAGRAGPRSEMVRRNGAR